MAWCLRRASVALMGTGLLWCATSACGGPSSSGSARGLVFEANTEPKIPIPGARVTSGQDSTVTSETTTGADGTFSLAGLPDGVVRVEAQAEGFAKNHVAIVVRAGLVVKQVEIPLLKTVVSSAPCPLSTTAGPSQSPQAVAADHRLFVAWADTTHGRQDILLSAFTVDQPSACPTPTAEPVNLSNTIGTSSAPTLAVSQDGTWLFAAWEDQTTGNAEIFFTTSSDGGATFLVPRNLSKTSHNSFRPALAVLDTSPGPTVFVIWQDEVEPIQKGDATGQFQVFLTCSKNGGQTFGRPITCGGDPEVVPVGCGTDPKADPIGLACNLSHAKNTAGAFVSAQAPALAVSAGTLHAAWQAPRPDISVEDLLDNIEIFYRRLNLFTGAIEPDFLAGAVNISNNHGFSELPKLAADGSTIYVVWRDTTPGNYDVFFSWLPDFGRQGQVELRAMLAGHQEAPAVTTTASGSATVTLNAAQTEIAVELAVSGLTGITAANIHVGAPGANGPVIFPMASTSFTSPLTVTLTEADLTVQAEQGVNTLTDAVNALLTVNTYVNVPTTANPGGEIRGQISSHFNLSATPTLSDHPVVIANDGRLWVAWEEDVERNIEVFLSVSTDAGKNWAKPFDCPRDPTPAACNISQTPAVNVTLAAGATPDIGASQQPSIAATSFGLEVVWQEGCPATGPCPASESQPGEAANDKVFSRRVQ